MGLSAPGGEIVFRHLFEGSWVIEQWAIWLPTIESRMEMPYVPLPPAAARSPAVASTRQPTPNETRFGLQTTGGRVERVAFGNETIWLRPRAAAP